MGPVHDVEDGCAPSDGVGDVRGSLPRRYGGIVTTPTTPRTALVLGAGGTVGMAYHAGALAALAEAGEDPADADLIVGTSAGAVIGSLLRAGWSTEDLWQFSQGEHPDQLDAADEDRRAQMFSPAWRTPLGFTRRMLGSWWVLTRSVLRWPPVQVPAPVAAWFRAGMASGRPTRAALSDLFGDTWPERPLWLCAVDITSGRRVVLGRDPEPRLPWALAVQASTAVPGLWPPVRAGDRILVDGGAHSTTNLDLAGMAGARRIICIAPMAYDPADPPPPHRRIARQPALRALQREVREARRRGIDVLVIRPTAADVAVAGHDMLRPEGTEPVAATAWETTRAQLARRPRRAA